MKRSQSSGTSAKPQVDVIIPVYGGLRETVASVETASHSLPPWARLVVINDCSPEPAISEWLREHRDRLGYTLLENERNLGFVATANRGMSLRPEADVVLLNSDVEVANDWLERLRNTAYCHDKVASVTATANNATICSFPNFCRDNTLVADLDVATIDATFRKHIPPLTAVEIPTGVGCCMYLRRDALDAIGLFDEVAFGRGYGEENDWCQRAIQHGWKNLHALDVFVFHKGAVSFAAESDERKEANLTKLVNRYPRYLVDVERFIRTDPAAKWRLRALIGLIGDLDKPCVMALSHGMGGGVETHIWELVQAFPTLHFLLLEPLAENVVRLYFLPDTKPSPYLDFELPQQLDMLLDVVSSCGVSHLHYHHTMRLPTRLWGLPDDLGVAYDVTLHDFWVINGNPTLTDEAGRYVGDQPDRDIRCQAAYPLPKGVNATQWRQNQLALLAGARYLICPSQDTMQRIRAELEYAALDNWVATPHPDHSQLNIEPLVRFSGSPLRVVVLGALSREKGADILEQVACELRGEPIEFHLLGYAYRELNKAVITHGEYPLNECLQRLTALKPDVIWFTAQWPETYSYTLSSALQAAAPIVAPNIGAFPERLAGRSATRIVDEFQQVESWLSLWREILSKPASVFDASAPTVEAVDSDQAFYHTRYLSGLQPAQVESTVTLDTLQVLIRGTLHNNIQLGRRMKIRVWLIRLRDHRSLHWLVRLIPDTLQRRIKRFFSQPLHE